MDTQSLLQIIAAQGYAIFFLLAMLEGPIVTAIAGFFAANGYFNIYIIIALATLADTIDDTILYCIGKFGKKTYLKRAKNKAHLGKEQFTKLKNTLEQHPFKGMAFVKTVPPFATPGIILLGTTKQHPGKLLVYSIVLSAIEKIIYASIGYFSGKSISFITQRVEYLQLSIPLIVITGGLIIYSTYKLHKHIAKKFKKNY